jgi:hypothetical protein
MNRLIGNLRDAPDLGAAHENDRCLAGAGD